MADTRDRSGSDGVGPLSSDGGHALRAIIDLQWRQIVAIGNQ